MYGDLLGVFATEAAGVSGGQLDGLVEFFDHVATGSGLEWHVELAKIAVNRVIAAHVRHPEPCMVNQLTRENVVGLGGVELAGHPRIVRVEFLEGDGAVVLLELVVVDGIDGML